MNCVEKLSFHSLKTRQKETVLVLLFHLVAPSVFIFSTSMKKPNMYPVPYLKFKTLMFFSISYLYKITILHEMYFSLTCTQLKRYKGNPLTLPEKNWWRYSFLSESRLFLNADSLKNKDRKTPIYSLPCCLT